PGRSPPPVPGWSRSRPTPAQVSVPAGGLRVVPRPVRGPIPGPDVAQPPADLGGCVRPPVGARAGHLAAGQRLGNAVRARVGVAGVLVPAALPLPQPVQVLELLGRLPVELVQHPAGDLPWGAG